MPLTTNNIFLTATPKFFYQGRHIIVLRPIVYPSPSFIIILHKPLHGRIQRYIKKQAKYHQPRGRGGDDELGTHPARKE